MTPQQALSVLYQAARLAPLNAESHEAVAKAAQILQGALTPIPTQKPEPDATS